MLTLYYQASALNSNRFSPIGTELANDEIAIFLILILTGFHYVEVKTLAKHEIVFALHF